MKLRKSKRYTENHSANTKFGMGNNYGSGIKAKLGKVRDVTMGYKPLGKKLKIPPKSLA